MQCYIYQRNKVRVEYVSKWAYQVSGPMTMFQSPPSLMPEIQRIVSASANILQSINMLQKVNDGTLETP
eukprot:scaffold43183_cov66-Cyclotella_meneghiniana.AAC.2